MKPDGSSGADQVRRRASRTSTRSRRPSAPTTAPPATASRTRRSRRTSPRSTSCSTTRTPTWPRTPRHGEAGDRPRRRRHHAVELRHGGRGAALRLRPGPPEQLGAGPEVPGRARHGRLRRQGREAGLHRLRRDRPHQRPGARDAGQPDQGRLRHDLHGRHALHQVDRRARQHRSRATSRARRRAARRSSTRPAPAPTSRAPPVAATRSSSTSATSGPT